MANPYFSNLTEFIYVNRTKDGRSEGDYSVVKNFFKRARLRDDIFQDLTFFTKFTVPGDDRPDNVANTVYDDPSLDWVVLLSNNIVNVQSEWALGQAAFNTYITDKYGDETTLYSGIHHYESREVQANDGTIIINNGEINKIDLDNIEDRKLIVTEGKKLTLEQKVLLLGASVAIVTLYLYLNFSFGGDFYFGP